VSSEIKDHADIFAEEFTNLKFHGQKIKYTEFEECTFKSCDFSQTTFLACRFIDCHFYNCDFSVAKLTDTKLGNVEFISSKLIGIDWTMCDWKSLLGDKQLSFYESILDGSNFYGLNLDSVILEESQVKDVDFQNCSMKNAKCHGSDFHKSLFENTHLEYADFLGAKNISMKISSNHFKETTIEHFDALNLLALEGIVLN
jgi:uncharacterized protein YjbI with pentapeptide repeats